MRINIVGTSGCGKSTVAERLARKLGVPYIEMDDYFGGQIGESLATRRSFLKWNGHYQGRAGCWPVTIRELATLSGEELSWWCGWTCLSTSFFTGLFAGV